MTTNINLDFVGIGDGAYTPAYGYSKYGNISVLSEAIKGASFGRFFYDTPIPYTQSVTSSFINGYGAVDSGGGDFGHCFLDSSLNGVAIKLKNTPPKARIFKIVGGNESGSPIVSVDPASFDTSDTNPLIITAYNPTNGAISLTIDGVVVATATYTDYTSLRPGLEFYSAGAPYAAQTFNIAYENPQAVSSISGGDDIIEGHSVSYTITGFTSAITSITTDNADIDFGVVSGDASGGVCATTGWDDGIAYPLLPVTVRATFANATENAFIDVDVVASPDYTLVTLASVVTNNAKYLGHYFNRDGHVANGARFYHNIPSGMGDLVIAPDTRITVTNAGTITGWLRPDAGATAGKMYYYEFTIDDDGEVITVTRGLTSSGLSSIGLTIKGV
jgi:hypothetical protein